MLLILTIILIFSVGIIRPDFSRVFPKYNLLELFTCSIGQDWKYFCNRCQGKQKVRPMDDEKHIITFSSTEAGNNDIIVIIKTTKAIKVTMLRRTSYAVGLSFEQKGVWTLPAAVLRRVSEHFTAGYEFNYRQM